MSRLVESEGELDLATSQGLADLLVELVGGTVVVDLAPATFIDSSEISALVQARQKIGVRKSVHRLC